MPYCTACGSEVQERDTFCPDCGEGLTTESEPEAGTRTDGIGHGQATAQAAVGRDRGETQPSQRVPEEFAFETDVLGRRIGALFMDSVLLVILFSVFSGVLLGLSSSSLISLLLLLVFQIGYFMAFEASWQKTPGKALLGLKVVSETGAPITENQAVTRNLWRFIDGIAYYLVGFLVMTGSETNQRLGDKHANTLVVRSSE